MNARITVAAALAVAGLSLGIGACAPAAAAGPPAPAPAPVPAPVAGPPGDVKLWTAPPEPPAPVELPTHTDTLIVRPGMYEAGTDIKAGKWKTTGPLLGYSYWTAGVTDANGKLVEYEHVDGPAYITVKKGQILKLGGGDATAIAWSWVSPA
jgi:hypothetical protein